MKKTNFFFQHPLIVALVCYVFSLCLPFFSGELASSSKREKIANYISYVVENNTKKKFCLGITAKKEDSSSLPNSEDQFNQLYGLFNEQEASFASGYNIHHESKVIAEDISLSTNYSFFYFSSSETKYDEKRKRLRHVVYPVDFMFELERYNEVSKYVVCISKTDADTLLGNRGFSKIDNSYSYEEYKSLIKQPIDLTIEGQRHTFVIQNIYFEDGYYYEYLKDVFGSMFMTSYYMEDFLAKENVYFMSKHSFKNSFFLDYMNSIYDKNTSFCCSKNNLTNPINEELIVSYFDTKELQSNLELAVLVMAVIVNIVFGGLFALFFKIGNTFKKRKILLLLAVIPFVLYEIFKIVAVLTPTSLFFSDFSIKLFLFTLFAELLAIVILKFINKTKLLNNSIMRDDFYELDI